MERGRQGICNSTQYIVDPLMDPGSGEGPAAQGDAVQHNNIVNPFKDPGSGEGPAGGGGQFNSIHCRSVGGPWEWRGSGRGYQGRKI